MYAYLYGVNIQTLAHDKTRVLFTASKKHEILKVEIRQATSVRVKYLRPDDEQSLQWCR